VKWIFVIGLANTNETSKGIGNRFSFDLNNFYQSLERELGMMPENACHLFFSSGGMGAYSSAKSVKYELDSIILDWKKEDICVVYIGHGQENGWALSSRRDIEALAYEDLRLSFALHFGNLIFLNSCCFGGAGIDAFANHSGDNLLISPLPAANFGFAGSFFPDIIGSWKNGKFYDPENFGDNKDSKPVVLGNPELQKLFFPRKAKRNPEDSHAR